MMPSAITKSLEVILECFHNLLDLSRLLLVLSVYYPAVSLSADSSAAPSSSGFFGAAQEASATPSS
jgi:hypothetical protein